MQNVFGRLPIGSQFKFLNYFTCHVPYQTFCDFEVIKVIDICYSPDSSNWAEVNPEVAGLNPARLCIVEYNLFLATHFQTFKHVLPSSSVCT